MRGTGFLAHTFIMSRRTVKSVGTTLLCQWYCPHLFFRETAGGGLTPIPGYCWVRQSGNFCVSLTPPHPFRLALQPLSAVMCAATNPAGGGIFIGNFICLYDCQTKSMNCLPAAKNPVFYPRQHIFIFCNLLLAGADRLFPDSASTATLPERSYRKGIKQQRVACRSGWVDLAL